MSLGYKEPSLQVCISIAVYTMQILFYSFGLRAKWIDRQYICIHIVQYMLVSPTVDA